jgi:hypothetical protein
MTSVILMSLIITGIHIAFAEGNALSFVRVWIANRMDAAIGSKWSKYIQKPLWDCLPCMSSVWTIVITRRFDLLLICAVCGLNVIIARVIEQDEALVHGSEQQTEYHDEIPTLSRQMKTNG